MQTAPKLDVAAVRQTLAEQAWRLNNLYWITDKDGHRVQFRLNWAQKEFFDAIHCNNLILKARQLGFSTFINLLQLDTSIFVANTACGVIAHNDDAAKELFSRNIKYPYDNLADSVKALAPAVTDSAHQFKFKNGSSIRVATSMRSGTIQILHISEFGKICAKFPERAREIVTGSLETVGAGNLVIIESTAEGNDGYFYEYAQAARAVADANRKPRVSEYKFFFFPWWKEPTYRQKEPEIIGATLQAYFEKVEAEIGRALDAEQRNWYAAKRNKLGVDCYREYPSTPDEAFMASLEGTYYTAQLAEARQTGRIGFFPPDPRSPINTFWDLGIDDYTAIWFHQRIGSQNRFFHYLEGEGEALPHYANQVFDWQKRGYVLGTHYMPWDADIRDKKDGKKYADAAEEIGLRPIKIVRTPDLLGGIQAARSAIMTCAFDESGCELGLKRLASYRKDYNERTQTFMDRPLHDQASHGADAFRMFAQGYTPPIMRSAHKQHATPAKCV